MSITLSPADAERVEAGLPLAMEGDLTYKVASVGLVRPYGIGPPTVWTEAAKPCPARWDFGKHDPNCETCRGTGRTVVELVTECPTYSETHIGGAKGGTGRCEQNVECVNGYSSLGSFTVEVLPIIHNRDAPMLDDARFIEVWDDGGAIRWINGESCRLTLPPDAKPGQYVVIATRCE